MKKEVKHLNAILTVLHYIETNGLDAVLNDTDSLYGIHSLLSIISNNTYEGLGLNIPEIKKGD